MILLGGIGMVLGIMTAYMAGRFDQIVTGISQESFEYLRHTYNA